ncbi:hypothetical protein Bca101_072854 [Brassica carinata]
MSEANKFSISVIESFALFLRFLLVRILSVLLDKDLLRERVETGVSRLDVGLDGGLEVGELGLAPRGQAMEQTDEYVNGQLKNKYGDALALRDEYFVVDDDEEEAAALALRDDEIRPQSIYSSRLCCFKS